MKDRMYILYQVKLFALQPLSAGNLVEFSQAYHNSKNRCNLTYMIRFLRFLGIEYYTLGTNELKNHKGNHVEGHRYRITAQ